MASNLKVATTPNLKVLTTIALFLTLLPQLVLPVSLSLNGFPQASKTRAPSSPSSAQLKEAQSKEAQSKDEQLLECGLISSNYADTLKVARPSPGRPPISFPKEPLPAYRSPETAASVRLADDEATRGNFQKALIMTNDLVETARQLTQNPTDEAFALREKGKYLFYLKKDSEAMTATLEAVAKFASVRDGPRQVQTLVQFASLLLYANTPGSDELLKRALAVGLAETERPAEMSNVLRIAATDLGSYGGRWAAEFLSAAIDLCRKHANGSWEMGMLVHDVAALSSSNGNFAAAEDGVQKALLIWKKLDETVSKQVVVIEKQLASEQNRTLAQAYDNELRALKEYVAFFDSETARCHMLLASIAHQKGDYTSAHQQLAKASEILLNRVFDGFLMTRVLQVSAALKMDEGELACAAEDLIRALEVARNVDQMHDLVSCLTAMGKLALMQDNFALSENLFRVAQGTISRFRAPEGLLAANMTGFGELRARQSDFQTARDYLGVAQRIFEKLNMPLKVADVKLIRSSFEVNESAQQNAEDLAEADKILRRLAPRSVLMAKLLVSAGFVAAQQIYNGPPGRRQEAIKTFIDRNREAGDILALIAPKNIAMAAVEHNLMVHARESGNLLEAEKLARASWERVRNLAPHFAGDEASLVYAERLARYGASLAEVQIAQKRFAEALITLELSRGGGLYQLLSLRRELDPRQWFAHRQALSIKYKAANDLDKALNALQASRQAVSILQKRQAPRSEVDDAIDSFNQAGSKAFEAEMVFALAATSENPLWRNFLEDTRLKVVPPDLSKLSKSIPPGTVFILFAESRNAFLVLALRGGSSEVVAATIDPVGFVKPGDGHRSKIKLADAILNFRESLDVEPRENDLPQLNALGKALFDYVFPGRLRSLVMNAERLVISPETVFWQLPFAALPVATSANQNLQYLGTVKPITYTQSLSLHLQSRNETPSLDKGQKPMALVLGDPLFDVRTIQSGQDGVNDNLSIAGNSKLPETAWASLSTRESPPRPLPNSNLEAKRVACLYSAEPLLGKDASEENVRSKIETADVIHFATHSKLSESLAMSSGLLFSPPAQDPVPGETNNDGALQAWEIFSQLKLRAELVVLSACETALGKSVRGEGIVGLTRAFQYAGARSVIASQWQIQDQSTSIFMTALYENLNTGMQKDQALQAAMSKLASNSATSHPHYWAAFTLVGTPDNSSLAGLPVGACK